MLSAGVGYNNFSFPGFYKKLAESGMTKMVESERIFMGNTLLDRKLAEEKLRNEVQSVNDRLSKEVKSVDSCKSVNDSVKQLTGWHKGQTESFEVLATSIFKQHMVKPVSQGGLGYDEGEIYELQRGQLKVLGKHPGQPMYSDEVCEGENKKKVRGFEWDGVLIGTQPGSASSAGTTTMFLIEAKTNVSTEDISNPSPTRDDGMVQRMVRTELYLERCIEGVFKERTIRAQASAWVPDSTMPDKIVGVLVARGFGQHSIDEALKSGIWCVQENGTAFKVTPPDNQVTPPGNQAG